MKIKRLISYTLAITLAFPTVTFADVKTLPEVSDSMLSGEYWVKDLEGADEILADADEIKHLNESFVACEECNMNDLVSKTDTFDGVFENRARWKQAMSELSAFLDGDHYDGSENAVSGKYVMDILENIDDPEASTDQKIRYGIVVHRSDVRAYPTEQIIADDPGDNDFDNVQNSSVRVGEPVTVRGTSALGDYYFCNTSCVSGWIPAEDIAICIDKDEWLKAWQFRDGKYMVVTDSKIMLEQSNTNPELSGLVLTMGTVLEKVEPYEYGTMIANRSTYYNYPVWIPIRDENGMYAKKKALVSVYHGLNDGFLPLTSANIVDQAYKKLGDTYGWGGMLSSVDCSSYVRDVYKCFGLELPRNTVWQSAMPVEKYDISESDDDEKKELLDTLAPGAILFFKGHEMIYLGSDEGRYYVISATSSMMYPGTDDKARVRSVIVNTLDEKRANGNTWLSDLYEAAVPYVSVSDDEEELITTGGSPWINSDIKENITKDMVPSPKDDFHLYVNRDWIETTDIPDGWINFAGTHNGASVAADKKALEMIADENVTGTDAELVREFYNIAIDWDRRNAEGMSPMRETVNTINSLQSIDDVTDFLCDVERSYGVQGLFIVENSPSFDDSSRYIVRVKDPYFWLEDANEYRDRTEYGDRSYDAYREEMITLLKRLMYSEEEAVKIYEDRIAFETKLAEHAYTMEEQMEPDFYDKCNNVYTPEEAAELSPDIPLLKLIFAGVYDGAKEVCIFNPEYIRSLNDIYTEENLDLIKAYMLTDYVDTAAYLTDREAYETVGKRTHAINGGSGFVSYDKLALMNTKATLPEALSRAYLEKYDRVKMKEDITNLCERMIASYRTMLEDEEWLSEATRKKAIEKLDAIDIAAVYPDKWKYYYEGIDLAGKNYYEAVKEVSLYYLSVDITNMDQKIDKEDWNVSDILQGNAYYNFQENRMYILLGMLEGGLYHEDITEEELMGGIGYIIGHEISHAFDPEGAQFDTNGDLTQWWSDEDYAAFKERVEKLIAYYDSITVWEGQNVIGKNIQTEAIADIGGMKVLLSMAGEKEDFDYDSFFRSAASVYKMLSDPKNEEYAVLYDVHPLGYLRTNTVIQQFDEFYETYDVKEGDAMYLAPQDRICVW
ncbi:MAG: SH3 domain-containing protein [Lachnospiraceae bacterium]|nr:SH3 domain-containing protein [Lachnospiraceae bacterium]